MDASDTIPWFRNAVFYGIDIARYYDSNSDGIGDIPGLISRLDYIQSLGIDCLWLLPFYGNDRRDNGYTIDDFMTVHKPFGTIDDFKELVKAAHAKGIRIVIDLVVQHCSEKHPWFIDASTNPKSKYHDYFVWSHERINDHEDPPSFIGQEESVWEWCEPISAYYHHKFYRFQPDLNAANPAVRQEIEKIIDFWLECDIDGFRIDAATHLFAEKGLRGTGVDSDAYMESLRQHIAARNSSAILLAEADVASENIAHYFDNGDRMHMLYNFLLNGNVWEALARKDAGPIVKRLREQQDIAPYSCWLNFLRNLDELNLERLAPDKQKYVMEVFAPEHDMRIFDRGIRRRNAPMLGDARRYRMATSLLFSLPGAPLFVYGDEIGMGDNLDLPGRTSARLPMQWEDGHNGGFSANQEASNEAAHAVADGDYGYRTVNVRADDGEANSLLNFYRHLIKVRRKYSNIGNGKPLLIDVKNPSILAIAYRNVLMLHNLSNGKASFDLQLPAEVEFEIGEDYVSLEDKTIQAYGYCWIGLTAANEKLAQRSSEPVTAGDSARNR